jgi:hypothetical protein
VVRHGSRGGRQPAEGGPVSAGGARGRSTSG